MAERHPGSNCGRAAVDWEEAFLFYASLPPKRRDYQAVAERFKVSRRTVERHGLSERWRERARELDRESVKAAAEQIRDERTAGLLNTQKLIDASFVEYANQLVSGQIKMNPNHIPRLYDLRERIWRHQDDEVEQHREQERQPADPIDPIEHKRQVLRALEDAGALYGLLQPSPAEDDEEPGQQATDDDDAGSQQREVA